MGRTTVQHINRDGSEQGGDGQNSAISRDFQRVERRRSRCTSYGTPYGRPNRDCAHETAPAKGR